jgi:transposase
LGGYFRLFLPRCVNEILREALTGYLIKRRGMSMKRFIEGEHRTQCTMLPEMLDDYITEHNPARVVDVFVDELDLRDLGFDGVDPAATGRPSYHPSVLLKIYVYGYLNRIQSSRRLEREAQRNVELMWLTSKLTPDFKTIADFRKDIGRNKKLFAFTAIDS